MYFFIPDYIISFILGAMISFIIQIIIGSWINRKRVSELDYMPDEDYEK